VNLGYQAQSRAWLFKEKETKKLKKRKKKVNLGYSAPSRAWLFLA
jgi:hypothetical protein